MRRTTRGWRERRGERIGLARAAGAVAAGLVVALVLSVVLWYLLVGLLAGDPPAIIAGSPGEDAPPVAWWDRVLWHPMVFSLPGVVATLVASLAGCFLTFRILRGQMRWLVFLPAFGASFSPDMLYIMQFGDLVRVVAGATAALFGAVCAQVLAIRVGPPYAPSNRKRT